jgi:WD40 repeat protein
LLAKQDVLNLAVSESGKLLAASGGGELCVWDLEKGRQRFCQRFGDLSNLNATILVCTREIARRYDFDGNVLSVIPRSEGAYVCSLSHDGTLIAVGQTDESGTYVRIIDPRNGSPTDIPRDSAVQALVFSPDGTEVIHVGADGMITANDVITGEQLWSMGVPGRLRPSWIMPALGLVVWCLVALNYCRSKAKDHS